MATLKIKQPEDGGDLRPVSREALQLQALAGAVHDIIGLLIRLHNSERWQLDLKKISNDLDQAMKEKE